MLHSDLEAAGISYLDNSGRYCDFHSLRHTCGSLLAASGVHPKVAQSIMRHSTIDLTMSRYSHVFKGQESSAVAGLPDLSLPSKERQQAKQTGTDAVKVIPNSISKTGLKNLAENLALLCGKQCNSVDNYGQTGLNNSNNANIGKIPSMGQKRGFSAKNSDKNEIAEAGLEPAPSCEEGILSPQRLPIPPLGPELF